MSPTGSSFSRRSRKVSAGSGGKQISPRLMRADPSLLTTGMKDHELFNSDYVEPKNLSKNAGRLSNDFGHIPYLRDPIKRKTKGKRQGGQM